MTTRPAPGEVVGEPDEVEHEADARLAARRRARPWPRTRPRPRRPPRAGPATRHRRPPPPRPRPPSGPARRPAPPRRTGVAPFCGPYTAAAPLGPSSGLSTSLATTTRVSASAGCRPERSSRARSASAAPPGPSSRPVSGEEPGAERLQHPRAAVGARAAADAQHDLPAAVVERGPDHLAGAVRARAQRVEPVGHQQREPGHVGHLDDGHAVARRERRGHRLAGGPLRRAPRPACTRRRRRRRACRRRRRPRAPARPRRPAPRRRSPPPPARRPPARSASP